MLKLKIKMIIKILPLKITEKLVTSLNVTKVSFFLVSDNIYFRVVVNVSIYDIHNFILYRADRLVHLSLIMLKAH
jgi:hypothetical protein